MSDVAQVLLIVAVLLLVHSLVQPLAARLRVPSTVLLAAIGVALGVLALLGEAPSGHMPEMGPLSQLARLAAEFEISSQTILMIFLPILLFQTGLTIDVRRMLDDVAPVLVMAVIAVVVCTLTVGVALWGVSDEALVVCLLLGAIIATTDPVAVVGIFREVGAPRRLSILIEGESVFNDAAAIALFVVFLGVLVAGRDLSWPEAVWLFLKGFLGGALLGLAAARLLVLAMAPLRRQPLAETSLTLALAYLVFVIGERYLGVSGVVAVVTAALVIASTGRARLTPDSWAQLEGVWNQLGFWAASLIFIFASMLIPRFLSDSLEWMHAVYLLVLLVAAYVARAIILYTVLPLLTAVGLATHVSHAYKAVILWGGLRGAVTLALALGVTESVVLSDQVKSFVAVLATGFVLFTLLVNATTLRWLIGALKLDRLSSVDLALRDRTIGLALSNVLQRVEATAQSHGISPMVAAPVIDGYRARLEEARRDSDGDSASDSDVPLSANEQLRLGLLILTNREEELYARHFGARTVSRRTAVGLLAKAGRLRDGAKTAGRIGYLKAARDSDRFRLWFRWSSQLHRRFGIESLLAVRMADRFETLLITRMVLGELTMFNAAKLEPMLGRTVTADLNDLLLQRRETSQQALDALKLQYPDYERRLEEQFLRRAGLRAEEQEYVTLLKESVISPDIFQDLSRRLHADAVTLRMRPALDMDLSTEALIRRFPMFDELEEPVLRELCSLFRPRFAHPEERVFVAGDRGDEMYFLASGAVEVRQDTWVVRLGRGDFFGELAVLLGRRRSATVTAIAYCHLLVLQGKDCRRFLKAHPDLRAQIRKVAEARRIAAIHNPGSLVSAVAMGAGVGEDRTGAAGAREPDTP